MHLQRSKFTTVVLFLLSLAGTQSLAAAPTITTLSPASGAVTASITITGSNFGSTQGTSTVKFNGTTATITSWIATSIVAKVPTGATTGNVVVTVSGVASNGKSFTVLPTPSITSLSPTSGAVSASVTIAGSNFGATQGTSTVKFNGTAATPASWSASSIVATVPSAATTGNVVVNASGVNTNGKSFTVVAAPSITSLTPTSGAVGASVTIAGSNFGATQGSSTVKFNGTSATVTSWSASSIVAKVPTGATTGNVFVHASGVDSNGASLIVVAAPSITSLTPTSGAVGASVTIAGSNFGSTQGTSTVKFNGISATVTSWSATSIAVTVPSGATTGNVVVHASGVDSNGKSFTVLPTPTITSLSPNSGPVNISVTITGTNFGGTQGTSTVKFNGTTATPTSWSATSIVAKVPTGATTGNVVVTVSGVSSSGAVFTVTPPVLVSIAVAPANSSVAQGNSVLFTATGTYNNGSTQNLSSTATWSSTAPGVATISSQGQAHTVATGQTTIQASVGSVNSSTTLTVQPPVLASLAILPAIPGAAVGGTAQFTATGTYSDSSTQNLTATVTWSSSSTSVATITSTGLATGIGSGSSTITASQGGISNSVNLNVTATTAPPAITALVTPAPNAAGWNNSNATITFTCTAGSATVTNCPSSQLLSTEGANQVASGTVTDAAANSATANVTLNIDKTLPTLAVSSPADGAVFSSPSVTVTGTVNDPLSGVSGVTCNGTSAAPVGTDFSCNISLSVGVNLVVVRGSDVAGNVAASILHVTLSGNLPAPASIQITPENVNLLVNDTQQFTAVDELGRPRSDATWTVSNTLLASITTDSSPVLTALAAGQVTLTATVQGASAQVQVHILVGSSLPAGTVRWSAPPVPGFTTAKILQAVPTGGNTPDLYSIETDSSSNTLIRSFTGDGRQMWRTSFLNSGVGFLTQSVPDAFGGLLLLFNETTHLDLDGQTGQSKWQYTAPPGVPFLGGNFAIGSDGTIYAVQLINPGQTDPSKSPALIGLDGQTGAERLRVPLPASRRIGSGPTLYDSSGPGPVMVDADGSIHFELGVRDYTNGNPPTAHATLSLYRVLPDGSASSQTLDVVDSVYPWGFGIPQDFVGRVIPDGQGGLAALWIQPINPTSQTYGPVTITHVMNSGTSQYSLPLDGQSLLGNPNGPMVLGENGVAFASDGSKLVSFNVNSGQVLWSYQAPQANSVGIIASAANGGLVAKLTDSNGVDTVVRFDSTGQPITDSWTATGTQYYIGNLWLGSQSSGGPAVAFTSAPILWGSSIWAEPNQRNTMQATPKIAVRVARVINPDLDIQLSNAQITDRVQQAVTFWRTKAQILLNWNNSTIDREPACAPDQPLCSIGNLYDITEVPENGTTFSELTRRFKKPKGLQLVFSFSAAGSIDRGITVAVQDSFGNTVDFNVSAVAKNAQGLVTAHEIGHIFQLPHSGFSPGNLMCSTFCPQFPSDGITDPQIGAARRFARTLADGVLP